MSDGAVTAVTVNPRRWWILAAVSLGMFMALLDVTIVNIAVPAIISDLDTTVTHVSWVLNAYGLVLAVLFLSMGVLADKYGQKRIFLFGVATFTLFSLLCGIAPNIYWLIAFRAGQGVGGAAMAPISLAILLGVFPREQQGMAVGLWGALGTVAAAVGPSLGGLLVTYASWHWIFLVNVPIGVVALLLAYSVVPEVRHPEKAGQEGLDVAGIVLAAFGLFCLTLALIQGNSWGWGSAAIIALFVMAFASYPLFVWWELRTRHPMFDFKLLRIRSFTAANMAMLFMGMAMGGTFLMVVIFLVNVLGYSELRAALALTVMPLVALIVAPNSGRLVDRIGPRIPGAVGAAAFAVGLILLAQLNGTSSLLDVMWRVVFLGIGIGFAMPSMSSASVSSLPPQSRGVGSGSLNTLRQVGFVLGVAILVSIFSHTVATNAAKATRQSVALVATQQQIPAPARQQISAAIVGNAKRMQAAGGEGGARLKNPLAGAPQAAPGSPEAQSRQMLSVKIGAIYRENIANSFSWPFYAAAVAALLAIVPALLTGTRLGQFAGYEKMDRQERLAADGASQ